MIQQIDNQIILKFNEGYIQDYEDILLIKNAIHWAISHLKDDAIDNETIFWLSYLNNELTPSPKQVNLKKNP